MEGQGRFRVRVGGGRVGGRVRGRGRVRVGGAG